MRGPAGAPHYLIDGYNVILSGVFGEKSRGKDRPGALSVDDERYYFLRMLAEYCRRKQVRMTVVWDGGGRGKYPRSETKNGVQNIFTPSGLKADDQIIRLVEKRENPREVTVVSDDRRHIIGVVRNLGAQTMTVSQFVGLISSEGGRQVRGARPFHGKRATGRRERVPGGEPGEKDSCGESGGAEKRRADDLSVEEWLKLFELKKNRGGNGS